MRYKRIPYLNDDDLLIKLKNGTIKAYAYADSADRIEHIVTIERSSLDTIDNDPYVDIVGKITVYSIYLKKFISYKTNQKIFIRKNKNNYTILG